MFVHEWFARTALARLNNIAIQCAQEEISYSDLLSQIQIIADALRSSRARKGDRVVILNSSRINAVYSVIACLQTQCVFVPLRAADPAPSVTPW